MPHDSDPRSTVLLPRLLFVGVLAMLGTACGAQSSADEGSDLAGLTEAGEPGYCAPPAVAREVLVTRPSDEEQPIDDVNWFARPVPHAGDDRIIAFASHDQNYLYNLTDGSRVPIPDRSDAVATPDGRYMTVPSYYTPDSTVRFYPVEPMLDRLTRGEDATDIEPAFIHDHPAMARVYYQSAGVVSDETTDEEHVVTYRLMFSGTNHESRFRIADYRFQHDAATGDLLAVTPSDPMALCPLITNDLNTPFISKDGRYVAAYTSEAAEPEYTPGASLKLFRITSVDPARGTTTCERVADLGFAAGKADFSFDGSMLTFHISQGAYLTPFVNGGLPAGTITDVAVARLERDPHGDIVGVAGLQRLTTSLESGVGSYFPAFLPDGSLFYIANSVPRDSDDPKRFHFRVVDPRSGPWPEGVFEGEGRLAGWQTIESLWEQACLPSAGSGRADPFPLDAHEAPWLGLSLDVGACQALLRDSRAAGESAGDQDWRALERLCLLLEP